MVILIILLTILAMLAVADWMTGGKITTALGARACYGSEKFAAAIAKPDAEASLLIAKMKQKLAEAKLKLVDITAKRAKVAESNKATAEAIAKYDKVAQRAAAAGNEMDVRSAVVQKRALTEKLKPAEAQLVVLDEAIEKLEKIILAKQSEIELAEMQKTTKLAQLETNNITSELNALLGSLGDSLDGAVNFGALDDALRQSEAKKEVEAKFNDTDVVDKYSTADQSAETDKEVAAYMAAKKE